MQYIHTLRGNSKQECNCTDNGHGTGTVPTYHWTGHCITSIIFLQRSRDENCPNIYHWTGLTLHGSIIFLQWSQDGTVPLCYWTGLTLHGFLYIPTVVTGQSSPIMLQDGTHTTYLPLYFYRGHGTELSHDATGRDSHCMASTIFLQWSWDRSVPLCYWTGLTLHGFLWLEVAQLADAGAPLPVLAIPVLDQSLLDARERIKKNVLGQKKHRNSLS